MRGIRELGIILEFGGREQDQNTVFPVKEHNATGVGEMYRGPLGRTYLAGRKYYPRLGESGEKVVLRLLVEVMNDSMGPKTCVSSLLVFSVISYLPDLNNRLPQQVTEWQHYQWCQQNCLLY